MSFELVSWQVRATGPSGLHQFEASWTDIDGYESLAEMTQPWACPGDSS